MTGTSLSQLHQFLQQQLYAVHNEPRRDDQDTARVVVWYQSIMEVRNWRKQFEISAAQSRFMLYLFLNLNKNKSVEYELRNLTSFALFENALWTSQINVLDI